MGGASKVIQTATNAVKEVVEEVPIVGQPAGELVASAADIPITLTQELEKPILQLQQEIGLAPEAPRLPREPNQREVDFQSSGARPPSSRQFSAQAEKPRSRRSNREGTPLGSILLSPSVLGTSSSVLGGNSGNLG